MIRKSYILIALLLSINVYAQVADSLYNLGFRYYNNKDYESAKRVLSFLIDRKMTSQDSSDVSTRYNRYRFNVDLAYDLLKEIYYKERDYQTALLYNERQYEFSLPKGPVCGNAIFTVIKRKHIFSAECYCEMGFYDSAMEISSHYIDSEGMLSVFVNSGSKQFGKLAFQEEFLEEFEKIEVPNFILKHYPGDSDSIKGVLISESNSITLNLFSYKISVFMKEIEKLQNDLYDGKITHLEANSRLKAAFKNQPIYKLIIES